MKALRCIGCGSTEDLRQFERSPVLADNGPTCICRDCYGQVEDAPPFDSLNKPIIKPKTDPTDSSFTSSLPAFPAVPSALHSLRGLFEPWREPRRILHG